MTSAHLETEFMNLRPKLGRLQQVMRDQLAHLVDESGLTLGVPIESRLKTWDSINEKLKRKGQTPVSLSEVEDLLGVRLIFLFQRDLDTFVARVENTFDVHSKEDTTSRLGATQFGYNSKHYIVSLPASWPSVPTMSGLAELKAEIQIRTLSQHIWAAASHKLQYKQESGVPEPIRRSIHRVSALLELVDIELTRVIDDRDAYIEAKKLTSHVEDALDVSVIEAVLDEELPAANKDVGREIYADLLRDMRKFGVTTRGQLQSLLRSNHEAMMRSEYERVNDMDDDFPNDDDDEGRHERRAARAGRGVFFTHVGLARAALSAEFGDEEISRWLISNTVRH